MYTEIIHTDCLLTEIFLNVYYFSKSIFIY